MTEQERYARCLPPLLKHEGGLVQHPQDPGGRTCKGVTQRTYDGWRTRKGLPKRDVALIEDAEVSAIYREGYWLAADCDKLPAGVDYVTFDSAVNQGVGRAVRLLQEAAGVVADGQIGPKTLAAVRAADPRALVQRIAALREEHYRSLKTFPTFGKGWLRRLNEVTAKALIWAA